MRYLTLLDSFRGFAGIIRIIGHQGARGLLPENNISRFENILKIGVTLFELDAVFYKDKTPIITRYVTVNSFLTREFDGQFVQENIEISSLAVE